MGNMRKSGAMRTEKICNNCNCFDYRVLVCCNEKSQRVWDFVDPLIKRCRKTPAFRHGDIRHLRVLKKEQNRVLIFSNAAAYTFLR